MSARRLLAFAAAAALFGGACRQDMHDQPKLKAQAKSDFFADGRAGRDPVPGTIAVGDLREDAALYTGKVNGQFITQFPIKVDAAVMARGRDRFQIFCQPCHGPTGVGNGMVVQRGHKIPPSWHIERLQKETPGYWFDVVTNGFGAMYGYSAQIPVNDRWAIIAYVRALQLSQSATAADVPEAVRADLAAGKKPAAAATPAPGGAH